MNICEIKKKIIYAVKHNAILKQSSITFSFNQKETVSCILSIYCGVLK